MNKRPTNLFKTLKKIFTKDINKDNSEGDKEKEWKPKYIRVATKKKTRNKIPKSQRKISPFVTCGTKLLIKKRNKKGTKARTKNRIQMRKTSQKRNRA